MAHVAGHEVALLYEMVCSEQLLNTRELEHSAENANSAYRCYPRILGSHTEAKQIK